MAWKTRLRGDNPKFIDIMEEGAADSSGAIARVPLRDGFYDSATRHAELIASAPAMRSELEHLRMLIEEAVDYIPVNSEGARGLVADMKAALANAKTRPQ